jgi:hypothetical protein
MNNPETECLVCTGRCLCKTCQKADFEEDCNIIRTLIEQSDQVQANFKNKSNHHRNLINEVFDSNCWSDSSSLNIENSKNEDLNDLTIENTKTNISNQIEAHQNKHKASISNDFKRKSVRKRTLKGLEKSEESKYEKKETSILYIVDRITAVEIS